MILKDYGVLMNKPTMFSGKTPKIKKVFIIKNIETQDIFESPFSPKHFTVRESAEYTKKFMQLDDYVVLETLYDSNRGEYV